MIQISPMRIPTRITIPTVKITTGHQSHGLSEPSAILQKSSNGGLTLEAYAALHGTSIDGSVNG